MRQLKKVRWWLIAAIFGLPAIGLFLFVFAGRVIWTVREARGRSAMQQRLEALEATGVPIDNLSAEVAYRERTSPEQTERWLAVLNEFDSEEFKQSLGGVYNFDPQLSELPFEASGPWSCEEATRRFIDAHRPMIEELRELCAYRQPVRFPYHFDSMQTLLPYTQHMREVARLFLTDGQIAIRDHDSARVRADVESLLDTARVCSAEPFSVSQLVCMSIEFMAVDLLKSAVEHDRLVLEDLQRLLPRLVERSELRDEWQTMIAGERSMAIPCFLEPHRASPTDSSVLPARGWDCIIYLDLMDKALAIDTSSLDSLLAGARSLDAEFQQSYKSASWLRTADGLLTGVMAPAFGAFAEAIVRNVTENRLAAHAVAVAIFHKSHGRWPSDLSELALTESNLAPPGGKPFGYRINPDGRACLWGFPVRTASSTPAEPPLQDGPASEVEELRRCIWHLPAP